jgi:Amt family ammonium transporter
LDISGFICDHYEYKVWVWNLIGLIAITLWAGGICALMFFTLKICGVLRIDRDTEIRGLDIKKHGEPAYPTAAYGHGWDKEGDLDMTNVKQLGAAGHGDMGKRNTHALANPYSGKGWNDTIASDGLIALALGYRKSYYQGTEENGDVEEEPKPETA